MPSPSGLIMMGPGCWLSGDLASGNLKKEITKMNNSRTPWALACQAGLDSVLPLLWVKRTTLMPACPKHPNSFFFFLAALWGMQDLSSPTRD